MAARLVDGRALAKRHGAALRARVAALPRPPGLAVVRVGDDPASAVYVARKEQRAERLGFHRRNFALPAATAEAELLALVDELNADPAVDGVLVQLPLPPHIDATRVLDRIHPDRDVDGFHPRNLGLLAQGRPRFVPCTPRGVMHLLAEEGVALEGRRAVVIGRSNIVGRPLAMLLEQAHATVTLCHSRTRDLGAVVAEAEVVVAAVGRPGTVRADWIRPGAAVVDVGVNRLPDGRLVGDVEPAAVERAGLLTPVPGGVGPLTISMLMDNTVRAAEAATGLRPW